MAPPATRYKRPAVFWIVAVHGEYGREEITVQAKSETAARSLARYEYSARHARRLKADKWRGHPSHWPAFPRLADPTQETGAKNG